MKHNSYYPTSVPQQILWLVNFFNKLLVHYSTLGLSDAQRDAAVADARWIIYLLGTWQPAERAWAQSTTDFVRAAQTGTGNAPMTLTTFTAPPMPLAMGTLPDVTPTAPGALGRIFSLVQIIQEAPAYGDAIATDLGTVGTQVSGPDLATIQPVITLSVVGNSVNIGWGWQGFSAFLDMLELQVDRGAGWEPLSYDTTPNYTDSAAFPANPTKWKYRGIYRVGDHQVGVWSSTQEITVGI